MHLTSFLFNSKFLSLPISDSVCLLSHYIIITSIFTTTSVVLLFILSAFKNPAMIIITISIIIFKFTNFLVPLLSVLFFLYMS